MKTKLQMECELLMVEHDVANNAGNARAFTFRASLSADDEDKNSNLETAKFFAGRKDAAQLQAVNLRAAIAAA